MLKKTTIIVLCMAFTGFAFGSEGAKTKAPQESVQHDTFVEDLKKAKRQKLQAKVASKVSQQQAGADEDAELESKSRGLCPHCEDTSANLERNEITNPKDVSAIVSAGEVSSSSKKSKKSSAGSKGLQ